MEKLLKQEKEEEANRDRDGRDGFQPDGPRPAPLVPENPSTPLVDTQLADDLTELTSQEDGGRGRTGQVLEAS